MFTIPNLLTLVRFLGIPLFIYLALARRSDGWAIAVLMIGGATDYFDGKLARALNQTSRLGELADPTIDRLYIGATIIVLYIREAIPFWCIAVLLARDLFMLGIAGVLAAKKYPPLTVSYLGKAATFNLLYALPLLLLALNGSLIGTVAFIFGWAFAIWGMVLYVGTAIGYLRSAYLMVKVHPRSIRKGV